MRRIEGRRLLVATHNQRGRGSISIEVRNRRCVSIDRIIRIIEESMSSKVCGLLKGPDEAVVVARAHCNSKFVEDCVRTMAQKTVEAITDLPDDAVVPLKQITRRACISTLKYNNVIIALIRSRLSRNSVEAIRGFLSTLKLCSTLC